MSMQFGPSDNQQNALLANCISAISTLRFTAALMRLLQSQLAFDCAIILGYSEGKHPVYLYDSLEEKRQLLFQHYLLSRFEQDPFYQTLLRRQAGVFSLKQLMRQQHIQEYLQQFYRQTGWQDELCLSFNIAEGRWVMCFLGRTSPQPFSQLDISKLESNFSVLQALCQQHWQTAAFNLAQVSGEVKLTQANLRLYLDNALQSFAAALLTKREQHIASLLVQGYGTDAIAQQLAITPGTVKNHRKRIYAQLRITALGELFQLFLNHLLTHGNTP